MALVVLQYIIDGVPGYAQKPVQFIDGTSYVGIIIEAQKNMGTLYGLTVYLRLGKPKRIFVHRTDAFSQL